MDFKLSGVFFWYSSLSTCAALAALKASAKRKLTSCWSANRCATNLAIGPLARIRPPINIATWLATDSASSRSCVHSNMAKPWSSKPFEVTHQLLARGNIHAGGRLVQNQEAWLVEHGRGDVDSSLHAAR